MKRQCKNLIDIIKAARNSGRGSLTLQRRLFSFFVLFLIAVMSGIFLILFSVGVFSSGSKEVLAFLENELSHIISSVTKEAGTLSVEGVILSEKLSESFDNLLREKNMKANNLSNQPELLNYILEASFDPLFAALDKNTCSGTFFVADATINPYIENSETSRAGIYLKNMEPNAMNKTFPTIRYLRGPAAISKQKRVDMLPQWQMEFSIEPGDFFDTTMSAIEGSTIEVSRLYYWDPACTLKGDYEKTVLLCVPVILSDGTVVGICGFEVNAMLFKLQNSPNNNVHSRVFAMWAPSNSFSLMASCALFAGSHNVTLSEAGETFDIVSESHGLCDYQTQDGSIYTGVHQIVNLYPKNSVHFDEKWSVSIMIPKNDLLTYLKGRNNQIYLLLSALFIFSMGTALISSKKYIKPVVNALDKVKSGVLEHEKTNIQEIDDLFAFLAERDSIERDPQNIDENILYEEFAKNISTLSPAERGVFNLYIEGYTAKEITEILCLSINTIKTHNKRIYNKLNVSSRKELLAYVKTMKEKGSISDIPRI